LLHDQLSLPVISGAIQTAKRASDIDERKNISPIKIRVRCFHPLRDRFEAARQSARALSRGELE